MNTCTTILVCALAALVVAEPPSGYHYSSHSSHSSGGGGGYQSVATGYQSSEGAHVDPALLEQIRQILLQEEQNSASAHSSSGISSQYGAPSPAYGVPSYSSRVVGIDLHGIKQAIQVAQYNQISHEAGSSGYNYAPSSSYGAPSSSYGAPSY